MSIYGEGLYSTPNGHLSVGCERTLEQLKAGDWEVRNAAGDVLIPVATPEDKQPSLASMYALGKYDQERMCLIFGQAYGISTVALRFFKRKLPSCGGNFRIKPKSGAKPSLGLEKLHDYITG